MRNLSHNQPLVEKLLKSHWGRYDINPSDNTADESIEWGRSIDEETLCYALDPNNHYKSESGRTIKPRLVDLELLANNYRSARGDFFRPPLPDTSLLEGSKCLYCTDGDVYDFVFVDKRWSLEKTGLCAVCSDGSARGNPVFVEIAEKLNVDIGKIMWQFSLALLEYKFKCGLPKITGEDVKDALEVFMQQQVTKNPAQRPQAPATPAKAETSTQVCSEPDSAPDYDFGDGWKPEPGSDIPF